MLRPDFGSIEVDNLRLLWRLNLADALTFNSCMTAVRQMTLSPPLRSTLMVPAIGSSAVSHSPTQVTRQTVHHQFHCAIAE